MIKWQKKRLSDLCHRIGDGLHGTPVYSDNSDIYFINGNNLKGGKIIIDSETKKVNQEELNKNYVELNQNSLLISINGTLGSMAFYNNEKVMLGKSSAYLNFKSSINKFYYYYFQLSNIQKYFYDVATGSTIKNLSLKSLQDFEVPVPEKKEWEGIASVLSALDDKIELNNRINAELEAMAKTMYDYWFVQFDFPDANGKPYKSSGGKMVYNDVLKREVPEGWEVKKLSDVLQTSLGGTPSTKVEEYWNGNINWLNSGEIANFPIVDSELKITKAAIKNSATELLPKGSVLLSITRHLRPTILAIDACANQSVVGIKEQEDIKHYFIYPYLKNEIPRLMSLRTGAQQPHINKEIVDNSPIIVPNPATSILKKYNSKVESCYKAIFNNSFQNQQLSQLRDWLLPMLMNGQVSVAGSQLYAALQQEEDAPVNIAADDGVAYTKTKRRQ